MSDVKKNGTSSREERLAEQLRANLRRRKAASRKSGSQGRSKKDTTQS